MAHGYPPGSLGASLLAALEALHEWLKLPGTVFHESVDFIYRAAVKRRTSLSADHVHVQRFWELIEYLESSETTQTVEPINRHRKDNAFYAISLPHFEERCRSRGLTHPPIDELKRVLPTSRSRKFIGNKTVNGVGDKHVRCWVFENPELSRQQKERH